MKLALYVAIFSALFGVRLAQAACPDDAVFIGLNDQIRGYSLRANGATKPCQVLEGPRTTFGTARAIAFSKNDFFHVAQFLTNGTVAIFPPKAEDNAAPSRSFTLPGNDLVSIAVDSHLNDFILSIRAGAGPLFVAPVNSTGLLLQPIVISDPTPNLRVYVSLAVDNEDNLLLAGYDDRGAAIIDTLGTARSLTSPALLRSLTGSNTGLLAGGEGGAASNNLTIAVDPRTNELFVYNTTTDHTQIQVSVFAAGASGNVPPVRTISGPATGITGPGFPGANKISVSSDGRLFVAEPNRRILVFAPGATGNVAPSQVIEDSTPGPADQGGIAVQSSGRCR
ncbi:hypothetical protein QF001_001501 [Paraburkholderia youngii]|uniref:NHL repeat containing protein n=1 Tax=Paraburkholderia youngii TaxID=2782701 RepID=A0A7Y6K086_9BURK|nr:hypothetical protein [Paraburkholderia youngii]NUY00928.1 hypothetical protein [Paraburkholderia youngii]